MIFRFDKYKLLAYVFFLQLIIFSKSFAQTQINDSIRPKVGLVLSGGGAKGLAHIGVLKVLEKYNIPIDYITGTSMGSIVGALYSIGYSAEEIEQIALSMDWNEIFDGNTSRKLISIEEKDLEGKFILEIPFKKGKPVIPTGVISAQKLEMELAKITWSVHGISDFSKFQIPFACIATDIETGEAIVLNNGYLPDALRASMAIPSVFTAVEINNKLLVDGGLIRNFPVSDAKKMGADIIIGVDVAAPLFKKAEMTSMVKIMEQAASFINDKNNEEETKLVDILIKPDIKGYDASSFSSDDILIKNGEKAALSVKEQLIDLEKKLSQYVDSTKHQRSPPSLHSIFINKVKYEGLHKVSENLVRSKLNIKDSSWISLKEIEKRVAILYGTRYFEKVNYRIDLKDNVTELIIRLTEQAFSIYKVGLNYNNIFNANVLLNATYRNVLGEGSRLFLSTKLGSMPEFIGDYSIFTKIKPSVGFNAHIEYYNLRGSVYGYNDSVNLEISNNTFLGHIGFVSSLSNSMLVSIGGELSYKYFIPKSIDFSGTIPDRSGFNMFGQLKIDNFDKNIYPNSGAFMEIDISYMLNEFTKSNTEFDKKFWKFLFNYEQYFPLTSKLNYKHFLRAGLNFSNNLFYADQYFLGGEINFKNYIFPLTGFQFMQIVKNQVLSSGMGFRYEPWHGKFIFINFNAGIAENKIEEIIKPREIYLGGALGFGLRTFIGPVEYKIGLNNYDHKINHWLQIGYYF
jgi:NTE family protein